MNTSLNFTQFTAAVRKGLQEKMGKEYHVFSNTVKKNNGIELTGIIVEEKNCNTSPTIYIDDFYENYQKGVSLEEIVEALYRIFHKNKFAESVDLSNFTVYDKAKKQIAFRVVNYEKNWEMLKEVPHKVFFNLAIIFYYAVQEPPFYGKASILIQNSHLKNWGIELEELYRDAMGNTPAMFPAQIENIEDVMLGMLDGSMKKDHGEIKGEKEISLEITGDEWIDRLLMKFREELKNDADRIPMYVLSNKQKLHGASCMFYPGILKKFAKEKECDLYILPSSIHEVILLPATPDTSGENLLDMVTEINRTQVDECEVLADSVYFYEKNSDKIERFC
ncbi:MAG: DUF5688 family protein [Suilimivivens sp.]